MVRKYRRYKNALEKFLASDTGRRFFHVAYSIGAAVVVLGALFKINHYPLGGELMLIGLGAEALIFFISAFDSPTKEYPWEEVFAEFATPEQIEQKREYDERKRQREVTAIGTNIQTLKTSDTSSPIHHPVGDTAVHYPPVTSTQTASPSAIEKGEMPLQTGNITIVSGGGGSLSGNVSVVENPVSTPNQSAHSVDYSSSHIAPAGFTPDMNSASENYIDQVNKMSNNVEKFNELTQSLNQLSDVLVNSFKHITDNSEGISISTKGYVSQMENLSRNIAGLNTIYEIQLKGVSSQINAIDQINAGLDRIKNLYEGTIPDSSVFRSETEKLALQLKDLNLVYARMLQAMTINMNMGVNIPEYGTPQKEGNRD